MSWVCKNCSRTFKHKNQVHSCVKVKPEDLFINKNPFVYYLYDKLKKKVRTVGKIKIHASRSMINFTHNGTFMVAKPKRDRLEIEVISDFEIINPPVYKSLHFSKNRFALSAKIDTEDDITAEFINLIKKAYKLS